MSSTKPEVHNVSEQSRRRTEPRPSATCTKHLMKSCVWFWRYPRGHSHRHTHRDVLITIPHTFYGGDVPLREFMGSAVWADNMLIIGVLFCFMLVMCLFSLLCIILLITFVPYMNFHVLCDMFVTCGSFVFTVQ